MPDRLAERHGSGVSSRHCARAGSTSGIVSGTHVGNVDGQLGRAAIGSWRAPPLPQSRFRGVRGRSDGTGARPPPGRHTEEDEALTAAARSTVEQLAAHGMRAAIVSGRLNRRKIDLIPEPEWADPPKARIGEFLRGGREPAGAPRRPDGARRGRSPRRGSGTECRLARSARHQRRETRRDRPDRQVGVRALAVRRARRFGIGPHAVLLGGDEFGPIGGMPGSDSLMLVPRPRRATAFSVGVEPGGLPSGVACARRRAGRIRRGAR